MRVVALFARLDNWGALSRRNDTFYCNMEFKQFIVIDNAIPGDTIHYVLQVTNGCDLRVRAICPQPRSQCLDLAKV